MILWRITKKKYQDNPFSGEGGLIQAARWHSRGTPIADAADSPALALLEMLVRNKKYRSLKVHYVLAFVEIQDNFFASADLSGLGDLWMEYPYRKDIQTVGDRWFEQQGSVALAVPSVVMPLQSNFLINAFHPDFKGAKRTIRILQLPVDRRLFEKKSKP